MTMSKDKRFEVVFEQRNGISETIRILRDTETGVHYLQTWTGASGGVTPLLGADGKPVVSQ